MVSWMGCVLWATRPRTLTPIRILFSPVCWRLPLLVGNSKLTPLTWGEMGSHLQAGSNSPRIAHTLCSCDTFHCCLFYRRTMEAPLCYVLYKLNRGSRGRAGGELPSWLFGSDPGTRAGLLWQREGPCNECCGGGTWGSCSAQNPRHAEHHGSQDTALSPSPCYPPRSGSRKLRLPVLPRSG